MNTYYQYVLDFFGEDWFQSNWKDFTSKRNKYPQDSLNREIVINELGLHPLLSEVFRYQKDTTINNLDFDRITPASGSDFIFQHLGRDLSLLKEEIEARGKQIQKDLKSPFSYENHRFNLMVAAGYKLLGFKVEFVPSQSSTIKTPDLLVDDKYYIVVAVESTSNGPFQTSEKAEKVKLGVGYDNTRTFLKTDKKLGDQILKEIMKKFAEEV